MALCGGRWLCRLTPSFRPPIKCEVCGKVFDSTPRRIEAVRLRGRRRTEERVPEEVALRRRAWSLDRRSDKEVAIMTGKVRCFGVGDVVLISGPPGRVVGEVLEACESRRDARSGARSGRSGWSKRRPHQADLRAVG